MFAITMGKFQIEIDPGSIFFQTRTRTSYLYLDPRSSGEPAWWSERVTERCNRGRFWGLLWSWEWD